MTSTRDASAGRRRRFWKPKKMMASMSVLAAASIGEPTTRNAAGRRSASDGGTAQTRETGATRCRVRRSAGAELSFDIVLGGALPATVTTGVAFRHDPTRVTAEARRTDRSVFL